MAFHGNKHEYKPGNDMSIHECATINSTQVDQVASTVIDFAEKTNIFFTGGKFPGYNFNDTALKIIKKTQGKWWALYVNMINRVTPENALVFSEQLNIVLLPTNVSGDIFNKFFVLNPSGFKSIIKDKVRFLIGRVDKYSDPVKYLNYLYRQQLPIIIQEHFQNQKTNGKRQTPNIYDDIWSLDLIYAFLKGKDVWHAKCGEIAHYFESYVHSMISIIDESQFSIEYNGIYNEPFLSIKSQNSKIICIETGKVIHGIYKNDSWVFNDIKVGNYRIERNGV
jgi:hypothetical protein